jgi:hypothetical protein
MNNVAHGSEQIILGPSSDEWLASSFWEQAGVSKLQVSLDTNS